FASMSAEEKQAAITSYGTYLREHVHTDSNMRGSAEYRAVLAEVFTRRGLSAVGGMTNEH
ncbi:MAG: molybdopterin dehydrogenase, partial [Eubacteriales bacterium]|nr:molybdopterin dehydrogenase [Eubacteriales bacterium]